MTAKQELYDSYVSSGQAGVDGTNACESARRKMDAGRPYFRQTISRYFPKDRQVRILDLGCGHGTLIHALKSLGYKNVSGVDTSPEQVELAHDLGVDEVELGDAMEFLQREAQADVVCCFDLLEHLTTEDSNALLKQIFSVLKPGGLLIGHVPNGEGLFGQRIRYGDLTHETCFTPRSFRQLLSPIGYQDIRCVEDRPIPRSWRSLARRIIWDVGTLWPRLLLAAETGGGTFVLSQNMLVLAKKPIS